MKSSLAFLIVNDLLFAECIAEEIGPIHVQEIVQARLNLDRRFREVTTHLARSDDFIHPGEPACGQVGNVKTTEKPNNVTCIKCLAGYGNSIAPTGIEQVLK